VSSALRVIISIDSGEDTELTPLKGIARQSQSRVACQKIREETGGLKKSFENKTRIECLMSLKFTMTDRIHFCAA
jgi:hypothetical protein